MLHIYNTHITIELYTVLVSYSNTLHNEGKLYSTI